MRYEKRSKFAFFQSTPSVGRKYASIEGACQNISLFISCYTLFIIFSDVLTRKSSSTCSVISLQEVVCMFVL